MTPDTVAGAAARVSFIAAFADPPFKEAVTCTSVSAVTADPAVAANVAVAAPAATLTDAGTANEAFEETTVTLLAVVAAFDNVTVQLVVAGATIVVGVHDREETVAGATTGTVI